MARVDTKVVLDDIRARDGAILNLVLFNDRQAMALFRIYVTVAVASGAAAAAGFLQFDPLLNLARWGLVAAALLLSIGCLLCIRAMSPADIHFPGRNAQFWQWTMDDRVEDDHALRTYLEYSKESQERNIEINTRGAEAMKWAKRAGIAAAIAGVLTGTAGLYLTGFPAGESRSSSPSSQVAVEEEAPSAE